MRRLKSPPMHARAVSSTEDSGSGGAPLRSKPPAMYLRRCSWSLLSLLLLVSPVLVAAFGVIQGASGEYEDVTVFLASFFLAVVMIPLVPLALLGALSAALSRHFFGVPTWMSALVGFGVPVLLGALASLLGIPVWLTGLVPGLAAGLTSLLVDLAHPRRMRRQARRRKDRLQVYG